MTCQARRGSDGQTRCAACRIVVDADETLECARSAEGIAANARAWVDSKHIRTFRIGREPFVSALAPDPFQRH